MSLSRKSHRPVTALAACLALTIGVAACSNEPSDDDALTETQMGDVDTVEGTISDSLPNFDTMPNPANITDAPKPEATASDTPATPGETPAANSESVGDAPAE